MCKRRSEKPPVATPDVARIHRRAASRLARSNCKHLELGL